MAGAIVVKVVIEFVGDGCELLHEIVGVLFASRFAGMSVEVLYFLVACVEELDKDEDAVVWKIGGLAQLLDLAFGECAISTLRTDGQSKREDQECEREPTEHWFLVFEDLSEEFVVNLVELFEGGFQGIAIFAGRLVEVLGEAIGGVMHEHLGVFEALGVAGEVHVDELSVSVDLLEGGAGLFDVAVEHLSAGYFSHNVDEFGVKEALVAGAGLLGF
jgi:hypothetical protein